MKYLAHDKFSMYKPLAIDASDPIEAAKRFVRTRYPATVAAVEVRDHLCLVPLVRVRLTTGPWRHTPQYETYDINVIVVPA